MSDRLSGRLSDRWLVAEFSDPGVLVNTVLSLRHEKIRIHDVYSPYPVHGLDSAMGLRRTRLPLVALTAGLSAAAIALLFQFYTSVVDWRINVGGKPDNSLLAFLPITFELCILAAGLSIVAALLMRTRLFPGSSRSTVVPGITDDRFAIAVRIRSHLQEERARELLFRGGAAQIVETRIVERGSPQ